MSNGLFTYLLCLIRTARVFAFARRRTVALHDRRLDRNQHRIRFVGGRRRAHARSMMEALVHARIVAAFRMARSNRVRVN